MTYFFTKNKNIISEDFQKIPLDEPLNTLTIQFIEWQKAGGTIEESDYELPEEIQSQFDEHIANFLQKKK